MPLSLDQAVTEYIAVRQKAIAEHDTLLEQARTRYRQTKNEEEYRRLRSEAANKLAAEELAWQRLKSVKTSGRGSL